jgi:rare lipoprotein A
MTENTQKFPAGCRLSPVKSGLALLAVLLAAGGANLALAAPKTAAPPRTSAASSTSQTGKASWYGQKFQGRKTANGERFDMNALTCAHRTLPLGTWVRVTNLSNRKSTFLRVNDRGPVPATLIVDLSFAAAQKLGISGLGKVKIEPVRKGDVRMAEALAAQRSPRPAHVAGSLVAGNLVAGNLVAGNSGAPLVLPAAIAGR